MGHPCPLSDYGVTILLTEGGCPATTALCGPSPFHLLTQHSLPVMLTPENFPQASETWSPGCPCVHILSPGFTYSVECCLHTYRTQLTPRFSRSGGGEPHLPQLLGKLVLQGGLPLQLGMF